MGWLGLLIKPASFPPLLEQQPKLARVALPKGLPAPVERYYRQMYGDTVPVITSAVISGRGTIRPLDAGPALPVRFRFTHQAGQSYRHYIEATIFGLPVMQINEYYLNDRERMEMPWGVDENNPKLDQAGNLGMWAESIAWLPSILVTDPRVHWEAVDDDTAFLLVPFGMQQERFLLRFDSASGNIKYWEVMRYKNGVGDKILWINGTWFATNEGRPWAVWDVEDTVYNVKVDVSVSAKGP
jgi:hypothetical protein